MALGGRDYPQLQPESPGSVSSTLLSKNFCFKLILIFFPILPVSGGQDGMAAS